MAVVGLFTACDPSQSEKNFDPVALSSDSRPATGNQFAGRYFVYVFNANLIP